MGGVFVSRRPTERSEVEGEGKEGEEEDEEEWRKRNNYTMFDLNIEEVEVTLSLPKWFDGKGLVNEAKVKGVRGVIGEFSALELRVFRMARRASRGLC